MAFAPDGLTSVGGYPKAGDAAKNEEDAAAAFGKVDRPKMTEDFVASANYLKGRPDSTGKLGAVGFCFGGGIVNDMAGFLAAIFPLFISRENPTATLRSGVRAIIAFTIATAYDARDIALGASIACGN